MNTVELHRVTKTYAKGTITAVSDVSFAVKRGELFGLIGPDGAGKTSIFRVLATLLLADSGTASIDGLDVVKDYRRIREVIGYMPGRFSLYQDLTVEENLNFFATLFGTSVTESRDLINDIYVQLEPFKDRRAGKLSGGMKQKLALCCALVHRPSVLLLDEPTTGVDPVSRKEFWAMLARLKEQGISIVVSTPYMDEANLCDRIALIQSGRLMSVDTPEGIIAGYDTPLFGARAEHMYLLQRSLLADPRIETCYTFGEELHLTFVNGAIHTLDDVVESLRSAGHKDVLITSIRPTIEDRFIRLMAQ
ncbi:MAG: ABC transporter ATP-binding protein [Ignavibacteria bacterium]|nr:ABC transporter ATP-binding protein [Ignavibacteria bacterium]MBK6418934.1 ABC transporter ATP-binding protein [Ignavibacteria bacterium]MBK6760377.1 ABC transporter ATP-binding protein [Ignavibacteria bacterium]MBK7186639.1 ABC transporter ATP-binding protein [Ignavibacteria bacterium]MBK7411840.1 ABC transporter ATP-binding protein [Ignavibacteria bacterium]